MSWTRDIDKWAYDLSNRYSYRLGRPVPLGWGFAEFWNATGGSGRVSSRKVNDYVLSYQKNAENENTRYWTDYIANTGKSPVYPYRTGQVYNETAIYNAQASNAVLDNQTAKQLVKLLSMATFAGLREYHDWARQYHPSNGGYDYEDVMTGTPLGYS